MTERLSFAAALSVALWRAFDVEPCGFMWTIDNPCGFELPVAVCGCNYPTYKVMELRRA